MSPSAQYRACPTGIPSSLKDLKPPSSVWGGGANRRLHWRQSRTRRCFPDFFKTVNAPIRAAGRR
eukprot:3355580-Pyramimonas_sp.AAC.1